jgi:ATP-dependent Clp protease ATP-binding subunit ClpC
MQNKMERFTKEARITLSLSQEAAESMGQYRILAEHMLLAITSQKESKACAVLNKLGINLDSLEEHVKQVYPPEPKQEAHPLRQTELGIDVKKALELTVDSTRQMGHPYIGVEHLLLGIMRLNKAEIEGILLLYNTDANTILENTKAVLQPESDANDKDDK